MAKEIKGNENQKTTKAKRKIPSAAQIEEFYKDALNDTTGNYSEKEKKMAKMYFNAKEEKAKLDKESAERKEARKNMTFKEKFKEDFVPTKSELFSMILGMALVSLGFLIYQLVAYLIAK